MTFTKINSDMFGKTYTLIKAELITPKLNPKIKFPYMVLTLFDYANVVKAETSAYWVMKDAPALAGKRVYFYQTDYTDSQTGETRHALHIRESKY